MNRTKSQQGFTLIELIVVIVILGILAVTAAPKFIDVSSDAKNASRQGVISAIRGVYNMGNAKAAVIGKHNSSGEISVNGVFVNIVNGYPSVTADGTGAGTSGNGYNILELLNLDSSTTATDQDDAAATKATDGITSLKLTVSGNCVITLTDAAANGQPGIATSGDCA